MKAMVPVQSLHDVSGNYYIIPLQGLLVAVAFIIFEVLILAVFEVTLSYFIKTENGVRAISRRVKVTAVSKRLMDDAVNRVIVTIVLAEYDCGLIRACGPRQFIHAPVPAAAGGPQRDRGIAFPVEKQIRRKELQDAHFGTAPP